MDHTSDSEQANEALPSAASVESPSADIGPVEERSDVHAEQGMSGEMQTDVFQEDVLQFVDDPKASELSADYVGRWSRLISTTNWEKGKIILQWREALAGSQSPSAAYSDEAWSRRVGGVTPQHVGRLRRVSERFGDEYETYSGLYWSHFLAALDWHDAQMWLEGAMQSSWSVTQMRRMRWEATGSDPSQKPTSADLVQIDEDEDYAPLAEVDDRKGVADDPHGIAEGPRYDGPDFGDEGQFSAAESVDEDELPWEDESPPPQSSPFANLPSLPVDLSEALEQFKLAIIRHRADHWAETSQEDVLRALDALKVFAAL